MGLTVLMFFAASIFFAGCLDIPSAPEKITPLETVNLYTLQNNTKDSTLLKVNPGSSSTIVADIKPDSYKKKLKIQWFRTSSIIQDDEDGDVTLLGTDFSLAIPEGAPRFLIPDSLVVEDQQGNRIEKKFEIIVNSPPEFTGQTKPLQNDTIYAKKNQAITFSWAATDQDSNDALFYTLVIDDVTYPVGGLTSVQQSGFKPGKHSFQVIATDPLNDADTLELRTFTVLEPKGDE